MELKKGWEQTLSALKWQMGKQTFDQWLSTARPLHLEDGTLTIGVRSPEAAAWLGARLAPVVTRAAVRQIPGVLSVAFVDARTFRVAMGEGAQRPDPPEKSKYPNVTDCAHRAEGEDLEVFTYADPALLQFDVETAGWSKLANYATTFWSELLGPAAFLVWVAVKAEDIRRNKTARTPGLRYSVARLARIAAGGNSQAITGVWRTCRSQSMVEGDQPCEHCQERGGERTAAHVCRYWRPGAFDVLQMEGAAQIQRMGAGLKTSYRITVWNILPLLTPAQAARLNPVTQEQHDRWIRRQGLDPEQWERLTVASLALPMYEATP